MVGARKGLAVAFRPRRGCVSPRHGCDGRKNLFSFKPLLTAGEAIFTSRPEGAINDYTVTIRLVAEVESEYVF